MAIKKVAYRVEAHLGQYVFHKDFSELFTAQKCYDRLVAHLGASVDLPIGERNNARLWDMGTKRVLCGTY